MVLKYANVSLETLSTLWTEQLDASASKFLTKLKLKEFDSYNQRSQGLVTLYGRLTRAVYEKMTTNDEFLLQGTVVDENGARIKLDFSQFKGNISLITGQVLALQGMNPSGQVLIVQRIHSVPIDVPEHPFPNNSGVSAKGLVCTGPLCDRLTFNFTALEKLFTRALEQRPSILIIAGPIIHRDHEMLRSDDIKLEGVSLNDESDILTYVFSRVAKLAQELKDTRIFVLPSIEEYNKEVCLPQNPYEANMAEKPSNLYFANNPSTIRLPKLQTVIGVTTDDLITDLEKNLVTFGNFKSKFSVVESVGHHILREKHYYPSFPPHEIGIDYSLGEKLKLSCIPDILILPRNHEESISSETMVDVGGIKKKVLILSPSKRNATITSFQTNVKNGQLKDQMKFDTL